MCVDVLEHLTWTEGNGVHECAGHLLCSSFIPQRKVICVKDALPVFSGEKISAKTCNHRGYLTSSFTIYAYWGFLLASVMRSESSISRSFALVLTDWSAAREPQTGWFWKDQCGCRGKQSQPLYQSSCW